MEVILWYLIGYVGGMLLFLLFLKSKKAIKKANKKAKKQEKLKVMMSDEAARYKNREA